MKRILLWMVCMAPLMMQAQEQNKAYSKFDFVTGDKVIYFNNFETDPRGELPIGWNTNGSGEVVNMNNAQWVKLLQNATFISDNTQGFSENFSVEFDLFLDFKYQDAMFPPFSFGILSSGNNKPNSNATLQNIFQNSLLAVDLNTGLEQNSLARLISYHQGSEYFNTGEKPFKQLENLLQQRLHVSMQVQGQRLRVWINEYKLFDLPMALAPGANMNQIFFRVVESSYTNDQIGIYVSNIKVAKGLPDTRSKLLSEGRFSTSGIMFDVNSSSIKPESFGIIKEVADVLKAEPSMRILIVGHTDTDGNDADNLTLSRQRSEAVKQLLAKEYGIKPANITTDGKGEAQPVADNRTREGKAQNRRVEFIRQ